MKTKRAENSDSEIQVSPHSKWTDRVWIFDNDVPGQRDRASQIDWQDLAYGGGNLYDDGPAALLEELRAFTLVSLDTSSGDAAMAPGSLSQTQTAMRAFTQWASSEQIESIKEIDEETSWTMLDWLESEYEDDEESRSGVGRQRELTHSSAWRVVNLLIQIFERRTSLRGMGVASMPERPFGPGSTALAVVTECMGLKREGRLHPIPDEVALPLLTQAVRMIGAPADDVLKLQDGVFGVVPDGHGIDYRDDEEAYRLANGRITEAVQSFEFRAVDGENEPWRTRVGDLATRTMLDGRTVDLDPIQQFRRLIISIVEGCVVVLQGLTGMRAGELIGLEAGDLDENGSPVCLRSRLTRDGAFQVFELHGRTTKGKKQQTYWVIGARPVGSTFEPPTVRAALVLARLLEPWRKLGGRTTLLVTFRAAKGLPRQKRSIGQVYSSTLSHWQKEFCYEHVDLTGVPDSLLQGKPAHLSIRGHRWRPTFAVYMYRVHSGLVPALTDHFKHAAQVMTESGYIGNNPSILDAMDAARVQTAAMMLLQLSSGSAPAAGPAARLVEQYRTELQQQISAGDETSGSAYAKAEKFVRIHDIRIHNGQHGACLMALMPMNSRCRQMSGTQSWMNVVPDTSVRTPSVCAGCQCYLVRLEHLPYWRKSAAEHREILRSAGTEKRRQELRVSQNRLALAEAIVTKLERIAMANEGSRGQC